MAESRLNSDQSPIATSLPRSLKPLETWGFGLTGLLLWVGTAPGAQSALGAGSILVWLPGAIIGILINLQVKRLGEHLPDVAGGTPNYITRLLQNYPFLASYTALGYFISWVAVLPVNAIILTDLIKANLEPLGITCPDMVLRIGFTLLAFVVAFSGTRALGILHLFLVVPSVALLLLFCVQGFGWLALDPSSPGLLPDASEFSISMGDWAKWYVIGTYAVYACETASSFVADSREPRSTLNGLNVAALLIVPVYLGGSWVLIRLANNSISGDNAFLNLLTAAHPFWGEFAPLIVTLLVTSGSLLACATAVSNSPRILYQLSQDGLISPVFGVISNQGVFGPGLFLTLFLSLLCLFWGNVPRIVIVTGIGWLFSFVMLHWGLWLQRDRPEALFPRWSLLFCLFEAVILIVGGIAWDWQDLVIGLLIPILILAADAIVRQVPLPILQPDWWVKHDIPASKTNVEDFLVFQVGIIVLLVSGAMIISWQLRSQLNLADHITNINLSVVLLLTLVFVGVAIACWTTLPQISAIVAAKDQAERNITERKLVEAALQQSEARNLALLNAIPDLIVEVSTEGIYLDALEAKDGKWLLSEREEWIGNQVQDVLPTHVAQQYRQAVQQVLQSDKPLTLEYEFPVGDEMQTFEARVAACRENSALFLVRNISDRKQAEAALVKNEERFRGLVANIPGAIYRGQVDSDWTMEYISDAIETISGYPASDFIQNQVRTYASIIYPDDRDLVIVIVDHSITIQEPYVLDYRILHRDGSIRWVYEQGQAVFDADANPLYLDGAIFDISDRKRAEEALRIAEENYRSIYENALEGIFQSTPDGHYLSVNPTLAQFNGYDSPEEMLADVKEIDHQVYVNPAKRDEFKRLMDQHGEVKRFEYQAYRRDGSIIWVEENTRSVRDPNGQVLYYEGIVQDITQRKQAEEALRLAEANYRSIFENALDGIFQSTSGGKYLQVNPAMARIYGYDSPSDLIANVDDIASQIYVNPKDREIFKRLIEENGEVKNLEYQVYQQDGSIIWISESTNAVRDNSGQLLYYTGIIQDITDRKRREDELRRQLEELKIEIDQKKREKEVAQLTESSYFQEVQQEMAAVNLDEFWS